MPRWRSFPSLAASRQPVADLPQRTSVGQLCEQHGHELPPTGETARMALGLMLLHRLLELRPGKQLQQLAENTAYSIHGGTSGKLNLDSTTNSI
jgi:hypothetical protein